MEFYRDFFCTCGKIHTVEIKDVIVEKNAILKIADLVKDAHKVFLLADKNTFEAAGKKVVSVLESNNVKYSSFDFKDEVKPDEESVGSAIMHYDYACDFIIAVGSGVINDIGKIIAAVTQKPYMIVATAPSMDGYASKTSSMERDSLKVSLNSTCADYIIGDIDVLKNAPLKMLKAGLGDMLAKYISICDWRIANVIVDEYYCEEIASLVRSALKKCVDNAEKLLKRDEEAVKAVFEGLVIGGVAMAYAGVSRPASGVEHYFSHLWDMRGLEFNAPVELHGIQCGIGTYLAVKLYQKIKTITPDREEALKYVDSFSVDKWNDDLRTLVGKGAETMILQEEKDQKYSKEKHSLRLEKIIENWDKIIKIIDDEIPTIDEIEALLDKIDAPKTPDEIGINDDLLTYFKASKDIRDKYVLSRLYWDLGIIDDAF